jgi:hypothetical protein
MQQSRGHGHEKTGESSPHEGGFLKPSALRVTSHLLCEDGATPRVASRSRAQGLPAITNQASKIEYIRPDAPPVQLPEHAGTWTEAWVPDTLDLAEMAHDAIPGMTGPTDPDFDHEVYWRVHFFNQPALMVHEPPDTAIRAKFQINMPLMRIISGSTDASDVEACWMRVVLKERGPDGLLYTPLGGRPWGRYPQEGHEMGFRGVGPDDPHMVEAQYNAHAIAVASQYAQLADRDLWEGVACGIVDGLRNRLVLEEGDEAFIPWQAAGPAQKAHPGDPAPKHTAASFLGWPALGMNVCWRLLGYEPARDLGGKLLRYIIRRGDYFEADGSFGLDLPGVPPGHHRYDVRHFHSHTLCLLHCLDHAQMTGDAELFDFARRGYDTARSYGETTLGWFPERVTGAPYPQACELCCVADMIMMAVKLGGSGNDDACWDDADRFLRNQFAEAQLRHLDWVERLTTGMGPTQAAGRWQHATFDRVCERNIGAFAGWADVNDCILFHKDRAHWRGIMHCCTANAVRAIYFAWLHMLQCDGQRLRINLLLNRTSPWADVDSHIPYTGRVDVKIKKAVDLSVRTPEWVRPGDVRATVNGRDRAIELCGRYAEFGSVKPGDVATLAFPIEERDAVTFVERRRYALRLKGNEVVAIDPPGTIAPLYQRAHYRRNTTRWHKVRRFCCEKTIPW